MFEVTRDALCGTLVRCAEAIGAAPGELTPETCRAMYDDMMAYGSPIDEPTRSALDICLDDMERASCCLVADDALPPSCATVQTLLDLQ